MKKYLFVLLATVLSVGFLASCKQELRQVDGVVTSVETSRMGDSVKAMRLFDGADTLLFSLRDARYNNGVMLKGDSVQVGYIKGHGDTLCALLVYVRPAPAKVIDIKADTTKQILTR